MILALDIATKCGWALSGDPVTYGTWDLNRFGSDLGPRLSGFRHELQALVTGGTVVIEMPWVNPNTSQSAATMLFALNGIAQMAAHECDAEVVTVSPPVWRKHFLGKGYGGRNVKRPELKRMTIARCKQLGFHPKDDNAADALGILDWAMAKRKIESLTGAGPLFRRAS